MSKFEPPPKVIRSVSARAGQEGFRSGLLDVFGETCAISGKCLKEALEAAHIFEYKDCSSQRLDNGILLRADIHRLFDCGLIRVDPILLTVRIDERLRESDYWQYNGVRIQTVEPAYPNKYFFKIREMAYRP